MTLSSADSTLKPSAFPPLMATSPIFALHAVGFPQVRSAIGRFIVLSTKLLGLQTASAVMAAPHGAAVVWDGGVEIVLAALSGGRKIGEDGDEVATSINRIFGGYCCRIDCTDAKSARVWYSYLRQWKRAQRKPTAVALFGVSISTFRSNDARNILKGAERDLETRTAAPTVKGGWACEGVHRTGRDHALMRAVRFSRTTDDARGRTLVPLARCLSRTADLLTS